MIPTVNHVVSLQFDGKDVDFTDADTYYKVSTVNYLAAGSCNFNNSGVSLWPLDQIVNDTQYYVRDAVIDYITAMGTVSPAIEGRLQFNPPSAVAMNASITQTPGADLVTQGSDIDVQCQGPQHRRHDGCLLLRSAQPEGDVCARTASTAARTR